MEFILFFSMLLITPCLALHTHHLQQGTANVDIEALQFPRKLRVVLDNERLFLHHHHEESSTTNMQNKDISSSVSGETYKKEENEVHEGRKRGTRQEWVEEIGGAEADTSQYFTMDYSHVRRRRPIHNKASLKPYP